MYYTVHFIITLFNVGNILLCVIYQLNCAVSMYVKYHVIYSILYYPWFHATAVGLGTYYPGYWGTTIYIYIYIYCGDVSQIILLKTLTL
jgi:hypothetical protein